MMSRVTGFLYRNILKRILFLFPADDVHQFFLTLGRWFGRSSIVKRITAWLWRYDEKILERKFFDLTFPNPVGLSAGFDYGADLVDIMPSIGFGFNTVGTLTHDAYEGNPPPMLGRLPKSKSLLVNKGFKNDGVKTVLNRMGNKVREAPRGVSIGATNKAYPDFESMITNLVEGFRDAEQFDNFDYYELNISCPNLINLQNLKTLLASPEGLTQALKQLQTLAIKRPVFIKMPLEYTQNEMDDLMAVASTFTFIKGLIFSNLARDRSNPFFDKDEILLAGQGNFSGKPAEEKANEMLRHARELYPDRFLLVGVGGIFTAEDAYKKILCGASLVQMITGMVFMGPQQIGEINAGLAELLRRDRSK